MTNVEKRAVARAIAKQRTGDYQARKGIYLEALSELGLHTNCCQEGLCGGFPSDVRLYNQAVPETKCGR